MRERECPKEMSVPRCINVVNKTSTVDLVYYTSDGRARQVYSTEYCARLRVVVECAKFITHCSLWPKIVDLKKMLPWQRPWAIATQFHSNHLRPQGYQSWKLSDDRSRTLWNNWTRTNSKNRKQFRHFGSCKVIYVHICIVIELPLWCNNKWWWWWLRIVPFDRPHTTSYSTSIATICLYFMPFRHSMTKKGVDSVNKKGCHGNVLWGIEKK